MENGAPYSLRLFGAACLTLCGLAAVAVGAGIGILPRHTRFCAASMMVPCCPEAAVPPQDAPQVPPIAATGAPASTAN